MPDDELLALDEALDRLATVDTRAAEMVKLCFFVGLTQEQAAQRTRHLVGTAERLWGIRPRLAFAGDAKNPRRVDSDAKIFLRGFQRPDVRMN